MKKLIIVISIVVTVLIISILLLRYYKKPSVSPTVSEIVAPPEAVIRESAIVTWVLDGDTIEIADGKKVRLIGIDTPELDTDSKNPQCFATESAKITKQLLEGQTIELEKDKEDTDKYGRLLRYVYTDGVFINEFLLQQGFGRKMSIPPNTKYFKELEAAENEAREGKRGLWKNCH